MKNFESVIQKIKSVEYPPLDCVIGIARGGIIPASMIAELLHLELDFIWLKRRNDSHEIIHQKPLVYQLPRLNLEGKRILLVEDRVKTGISLQKAKDILMENFLKIQITTLAINGKADISIYDETCFKFPWKI